MDSLWAFSGELVGKAWRLGGFLKARLQTHQSDELDFGLNRLDPNPFMADRIPDNDQHGQVSQAEETNFESDPVFHFDDLPLSVYNLAKLHNWSAFSKLFTWPVANAVDDSPEA